MSALNCDMTWEKMAFCLESSPDLFFPPYEPENAKNRARRETKAKTICKACKVKEQCLEYAKINGPIDGIWGGTTLKERNQQMRLKEIWEQPFDIMGD